MAAFPLIMIGARSHSRPASHSWHLVRCTSCRKMILNSAPKCPYCATWRKDARVLSVVMTALIAVACGLVFLGLLAVAANMMHQRQEAAADARLEQQISGESSPAAQPLTR